MSSPRKKIQKTCQNCNKQFYPLYASSGKYCTHKCSTDAKTGSKHPMWKGNDVSYIGIHAWNNKYHPKTGVCEECGEKRRTEWALKKEMEHARGVQNYKELCRKCHINYDMTEEWTQKSIEALKKTYTHQNLVQSRECIHCNQLFMPRRKTTRFCSNSCAAKRRDALKRERDFITGQFLALNQKDK